MPTVVQFRRGTTSQNQSFTGAVGELSVDTDLSTLRVHDGQTAGGVEIVNVSSVQTMQNKVFASDLLPAADSAYDLGDSDFKWKDLHLSGNTIYLGGATISASGSSVVLPAGSTIASGSLLDSASALSLLTGGTGITYNSGTGEISTTDAEIVHDDLSGVAADEHIAHSGVTLTAGSGLNGGGDISASRTFNIDSAELYANFDHDGFNDYVANEHIDHTSVVMSAGSGLTGGGDISSTRSFNIGEGTGITVSADAIATNDAEIVHDNLSGFVADEHIAHSGVTLTAGTGLNGGGDISASRTFNIDSAELYASFDHDGFSDYVANEHINHTSVTMTAGSGLTGGGDISSTRTFNVGQGTGITVSGDAISTNDAQIVHDNLSGFVADEHVAHSGVTLTAGSGLTGGGDISASRTFNIGQGTGITVSADAIATNDAEIVHDNLSGFVANEHIDHTSVSVTAGSGLTGGGTIAATRTFNIGQGTGITVSADAIATNDAEIVHDDLSGFVADEHIAHSGVTLTAGAGLTGGGTIAASRTFNVGAGTGITVSADAISTNDGEIVHDNLSGFVADEHVAHSGVTMTAGAGLTGGGTIAATRTFNVGAGTGVTVNANDIAIGQDVATTADVTFNSVTTTADLIIGGDLQVTGTTTTVNSQSLEVTDNMIYMNAGESDGSPTQSIDVGWAANVNDGGSYTHVGMFRDATDDRFKVFGTYNPEPDAALEINTGHVSFALADFQADTFYGNLTGDVTGNASTATALETARTIGGVSFDGSANINLPGVNTTGNQNTTGSAATLTTARTIGGVSFNGSANINLPGVNATGNQNTSGNAATATALATARSIGGVSFDGSANINLPGVNTAGNQNTSGNAATATLATTATNVTASANNSTNESTYIAFVDGATGAQGIETDTGLRYNPSTNTVTASFSGALSGNAATATKLATARTIGLSGDVTATGVSFDGTGNITLTTAMAANSVDLTTHTTGNYVASITNGSYITGANGGSEGAGLTLAVDATSANTVSKVVARDGSGNFSAGTITAALSGNASTATTLATGRTIALSGDVTATGVSFNGSSNITLSANIASNVVGAAELNVTGNGTTSQFLRADGDGSFTWATPTDTNTTYSAGTAMDLSGTTFNLDLSELGTSTTNGDGDYFVVVDTLNAQRKLTKANIALSGFNNDAGWTSNVGDITGVTAGTGLSGGGSSGSVTLNVSGVTSSMFSSPNSLVIYNSAGTALKTIRGPGS